LFLKNLTLTGMFSPMSTTTYEESVAAEIKAELKRQHRSQSDLCAVLGWSEVYLSRRLTGQVSFSLADIEQIAGAFHLPVSQFTNPPLPRLPIRRVS
jgi:transcriptional regulator with XRE-family HTH domain